MPNSRPVAGYFRGNTPRSARHNSTSRRRPPSRRIYASGNEERSELARPAGETISLDEVTKARRDKLLGQMMAEYMLRARTASGRVIDPVARFHLGNGARLERLNWLGDTSTRALAQSYGLMVNYLYDLGYIEKNHEAYAQQRLIVAASSISKLVKSPVREVVPVSG